MRKVGAYLITVALGALAFAPPPAAAVGLRLGPFHFGVPLLFPHRGYHRPLYMRAAAGELTRSEPAPSPAAALVYPNLALPGIVQNIFFPADPSPWPFAYGRIFATAFAALPASEAQRTCQSAVDAEAAVGRISAEIAPTPEQMPLLQKLGGALGAASAFLAKACPAEIPPQPVARLQLMETQIEKLSMAIDIFRQPLQDFEQALNNEQLAKFAPAASPSAAAAGGNARATACGGSDTATDWSIAEIDKSVRPTAAQRGGLDDVKAAFAKAASDLQAHCQGAELATALGRLEAIESRLDATWRSALAMQVALSNFHSKLSDEQKSRFDRMNFAAR